MGCRDGLEVTRDPHARAVVGILVALVALLGVTAPTGAFSIDESSYIATITGLSDGTLRVEATAELAPSAELYAFDAAPRSRPVKVPVASSSPPLYAPIALPFSLLGVRGLMLLQILSFAACAYLVFAFTRRHTQRADLAWLAFATFVLASFTLEYAQAIWPHALAMTLVMTAFDLASRVRGGASPWLAAGAGACVAIAAGIRYQNIAMLASVGLGLAFVPRAQWKKAALAFVVGALPFVLASSVMNHARHGSWNPVSKGGTYLMIAGEKTGSSDVVREAFTSTWSRVVDFSSWPDVIPGMGKDARTGTVMVHDRVKKALLQSAPWALLPLLAIALALGRRARGDGDSAQRSELLAMGVVVAGVLGMFAVYGYRRHDGWSFNQRYLLELMPLLSCALAFALSRLAIGWRALAAGVVLALAGGLALLQVDVEATWRGLALMKLPLVLALATAGAWLFARRSAARAGLLGAVLGASLGWAIALHLADDVAGDRAVRAENGRRLAELAAHVPREPVVLFAYWGAKDAYGPLALDRDIVIVDPWIDDGATARTVVDSALDAERRVFVASPMPGPIFRAMTRGLRVVPIAPGLLELAR